MQLVILGGVVLTVLLVCWYLTSSMMPLSYDGDHLTMNDERRRMILDESDRRRE